MTRALLGWFGRRPVFMLGALLLIAGAAAWLSHRSCASHRCPRAAVKEPMDDETARQWQQLHRAREEKRTQRDLETRERLDRALAGSGWLPRCVERLSAARSELIRHDPIFRGGVVEAVTDGHVRYALGFEKQEVDLVDVGGDSCEACAQVYVWEATRGHDWERSTNDRMPGLVRLTPDRLATIDPPKKAGEKLGREALAGVFERVMKAAVDDCIAMKAAK
jgi:hypothetical protein